MKNVFTIILILTTSIAFGQRSNTIFNTGTNELQKFSRQDFIEKKLTKVSAYSFTINRKGKVKKDSLLLYSQQFDLTQNKLFGVNCNDVYQSSGPSFLTWYEFEIYYNDYGQIIKEISKPKKIDMQVKNGSTDFFIITDETDYEYDTMQREVKRTYKQMIYFYSISKYNNDTFHLNTIDRPEIDEYTYNSDNKKIKWFHKVDSTKYFSTENYIPGKASNNVICSNCQSRYLNVEWKYNTDKKLVEWISYTRENLVHTKRNYFYDDQQRLIKQIDSTGWYIITIQPYLESTTTFQYSDTGRIVTKIDNTNEKFGSSTTKIVSYFDTSDKLIKECLYSDTSAICTQYIYVYEKNKITKEKIIFNNGTIILTEFYYNDSGFLREERTLRNGNLTTLIRYYYE